jgi:asparagine synthase (glutamine-hydrolysing)
VPGIVGIFTKLPRGQAERELAVMLAAQCHHSSYVCGTWGDETQGIYVGWTARKGSFADRMPLRNERGDVVLVFSGEDFSDPDVSRQLKKRGHEFNDSPSSYLVHLYEEDFSFPACLNGRFHGLLIDRGRHTNVLFNDRYGLKRLYFHESKDAFYFAAEAKAILAVRPELRTVSARSLGEYVSLKCVLENRALFERVEVMPPASAWILRDGSVHRRSYFRPEEWENQEILDLEDYQHELQRVFARNLPRYFSGPGRIAVSLTGGLDTRMIMAWNKSPAGSLPCYSFGSMYNDCQDVIMGRRVAEACRQPYSVITVGDDFLSHFSDYAERTVYLSDGCTDVSRTADLYVNEVATQIAPLRMTGNYGGEVLRRVRAFKPALLEAEVFAPELLTQAATAEKTYAEAIRCHPLSFSAFRQAPWHHYGLLALEETQLSVRTPYLDNDLVRTIYRAPQASLANDDVCIRLIGEGNPGLLRIRTDRGLLGRGNLFSGIRHNWLEFTFKAEYAYDYGMPQWSTRIDHALSPLHMERLFLGRHKFYHYRTWYRDQLSRYVRDMLLDARSLARSYVNPKQVEKAVTSHTKGVGNYTFAIHKLLTLELFHRRFIDSRIETDQQRVSAVLTKMA